MDYLWREFQTFLDRDKRTRFADLYPLKQQTFRSFLEQFRSVHGSLTQLKTLEVGCGSGITSVLLNTEGAVAHAVDRLAFSAQYTKELAVEFGAKVEFAIADAFTLPFPDKTFDLVFNFGVIEHYPEPAQLQMVTELTRVSSRYVLIGIPNPAFGSAFNHFQRSNQDYDHNEQHLEVNTERLFKTCGLQLRHQDGLSVYLQTDELSRSTGLEILALYEGMYSQLPLNRYVADDIEWLVQMELNLTPNERMNSDS